VDAGHRGAVEDPGAWAGGGDGVAAQGGEPLVALHQSPQRWVPWADRVPEAAGGASGQTMHQRPADRRMSDCCGGAAG